ncbi:uncharacterized protein LOC110092196 [Dendrobium catenatum]|uniref:Uncharacterized protein n=1 Tax=Dendrobium catenatum TaxID=906689 RepID=A0A2I0WT41_9ASPA|nr:uncharacterized protein LOC110092196 [Dendrobium catenatum]PKU78830.1 hypothetical protein MA16_Dca000173 [Dendrobium catenatum]
METPPTNGDLITGRPVGGTELSWCRAVPGGTGITVLALLLSRSISLPHLRSSLRRLQLSHPMLRGFLPSASAASASKPPPLLISPTPYDEIELIPYDLLPPLTVDGLTPPVSFFHAVIEHEMNRNPWAEPTEGKPVGSFFASVYELNQPGRSVVTLRFHTGVCDRIAGVGILKELMGLIGRGGAHREEMEDAAEEKEGEVGLAIEDLIRKEDAWKPFWARGKDLIGYSLNGLRSTCLQFEDAGSARKSEFVRLVMDAVTTRRLLTACDVKGIKLCSALTSAGFLATHASKNLQKNQSETYSVITLIDCRQYLNPPLNEKHVGFYHSGILNTHTVNGGEGFWDVAMRCHKAYSNAMKNKKHLSDIGELNFLMCKAIENPHLTPASSLRTALISVFEEPVDYAPMEQLKGLGVEDFLGCASVHGVGASIALFDTIRNGQLDSVCVYPSPLHSRKQMEELVDHMKRILMENCCVVDEGGH